MEQHGTHLDADIYDDDYILGKAVEFGLPEENEIKEKMGACSAKTSPRSSKPA